MSSEKSQLKSKKKQLEEKINRDMNIVIRIAHNINNYIPFSNWHNKDRKVLLLAIMLPERKKHHKKYKGVMYEEKKAIYLLKHLSRKSTNNIYADILADLARKEICDEDKIGLMTAAERLRSHLPKRCKLFQFIVN